MAKVDALQRQVSELDLALQRSRGRERDLLELLTRWQAQ